ncbi:PilZ domain-containing protein [Burkholderia sp. Ac-20379]|uniref:PilZ domain-containing protein n=1 Tax=Burkholderia sp. Ac-20379 TaxID=2703900 RepID=UPI0019821B4A|nr:PilZ domain-containing protein [Burkholderia sp. Ac-20379]MBN3726399.1 PilZ domain-containing protein [Burkholderia sp. Ac-20379]
MTEIRPVLPVAAADLTADAPLPWPLFDAGGAPLMPAGATLDADAIAFLFARFAPVRRVDSGNGDEPADDVSDAQRADAEASAAALQSAASASSGPRLALSADAMIGLRRRGSTMRQLNRFRLLGTHPSGPLFLRPLQPRAVDFAPNDQVDAMAIGQSAVYWFTAVVEAVAYEPAPYLILSAPANLKRVRERRDARVPVRLAARYTAGDAHGVGLVLDVSPSGFSIAADRALAATGESLSIVLPVATEAGHVEALTLTGIVRGVGEQADASPAWLHHVANEAMTDDAVMRLKAALFDWSMPD